jgi:hypothetical protein
MVAIGLTLSVTGSDHGAGINTAGAHPCILPTQRQDIDLTVCSRVVASAQAIDEPSGFRDQRANAKLCQR